MRTIVDRSNAATGRELDDNPDLRDVAAKIVADWKAERELPYLSPTACKLLAEKIEKALIDERTSWTSSSGT